MSMSQAAAGDRHVSIDAVRGFAVLGILLMNIVGMGMPSFAYINPTYAGGHTGADLWTWAANNVLTDGKMRALFTMLFGASAVLIAERAEGGSPGPLQTHYRRLFWLFVIGMIHAYFLWFGDILVCYALAGLVIYPFRKFDARVQIGLGVLVLAALLLKNVLGSHELEALHAAATAPGATAAALKAWQEGSMAIMAPPGMAAQELAGFGGGFMEALSARANMAMMLQTVFLPSDTLPEAIGQMFVGMGLFRVGFFTLGWSSRAYGAMIAVGYLIGAPVTAWLAWMIWASGFEPLKLHELEVWQSATRPFIALAHASLLLLIIRAGILQSLVERLAAAGRMAFSNYLMTSIITNLLFCGYGLGLYGKLSRFEQLAVVLGVWAFILLWSKPWLARFQYGPFEWLWRSLVRWRLQPFVRPAPATATA
ncbi:MAG: DUF418 domain-containing protein [Phenylobacterium sp.]|uniref:DUF418 domain-containing protein n=1 Tax=Phenylobacterium sp. TaxID=1871053 RepID=UPI002735FF32|nr:DUF418 domain-containing protein [Phenylobacterium sp.]MDP3748378.1 DUF418 domain-containing protein [Phenylobacterium sp.]